MLKLRNLLIKQVKNKIFEKKNYCTSVQIQQKLSSREISRRLAKQKYENYPYLLYNSKVELDNMQLAQKYAKPQISNDSYNKAVDIPDFPYNWMDDYEFYDGTIKENEKSKYGTPKPEEPPSNVPCSGCGANLHCASPTMPGYLPSEIFVGRSKTELKTITCQRCHFLKNYNIALDVEISADSYVQTISSIKDKYALAIVIVDLLDFPCSIWPGLVNVLGSKRPIFLVGNKVDLLPRDSNNYLERIKISLKQEFLSFAGFQDLNLKYVSLISAKTGYGIEELITQLHKIWKYKGDVYLMGCTNVGKSTLFNILLNSDYCRPQASEQVRKATTCPWPGTTLQMLKFPIYRPSELRVYQRFQRLFSERAQKHAEEKLRKAQAQREGSIEAAQLIGRVGRTFAKPMIETSDAFTMPSGFEPIVTLNEKSAEYQKAKWCLDTPGVLQPDQITNLLQTEELVKLAPQRMITPRAFRLQKGMSIFLAGLGRLDLLNYQQNNSSAEWIKVFVFSSLQLPVSICNTKEAKEMYEKYLGSPHLAIPSGNESRLQKWPGLQAKNQHIGIQGQSENSLTADIILSSAGWIGLLIPEGSECTFNAWTPEARGIYVRTPALIPHADRLIGKLVRNSLAYHMSKPFVFRK